ncbi:protein O-mannose kinase-like [Liolophura sinensis]|uniref:protein O-mannose kinase-like n=1 Tax=Liolophura sinensis TaxID=3198878 RepID=UPI00315923DA
MLQTGIIFSGLTLAIAFISYIVFPYDQTNDTCWQDTISGEGVIKCKPRCKSGWFGLAGMHSCHAMLRCTDWSDVKIDEEDIIGHGLVKKVYKGRWKDFDIVANKLSDDLYQSDFDHGWRMLTGFQPSPLVVQAVGRCNNTFLSEYHQRQSARNIHSVLQDFFKDAATSSEREVATRFNLCINYVEIIHFLHNSPLGVRVMCDTNDLQKTLDQYLITDDLHLVVNDLDALPEVIRSNGTLVKCGRREVFGEFAAPEQTWPYENETFDEERMPPYDEKTDIWKIPDVCNYFLQDVKDSRGIRLRLLTVHQSCKELHPQFRPTASEVLQKYRQIMDSYITWL